jgi:hypothetical protein
MTLTIGKTIGFRLGGANLRSGELTCSMLAVLLGLAKSKIVYAAAQGQLASLVSRRIVIRGAAAPLFREKDLEKIRQIMSTTPETRNLKPGELSCAMVAEKMNLTKKQIVSAVYRGPLAEFVTRRAVVRGSLAPLFQEKDLPKIIKAWDK